MLWEKSYSHEMTKATRTNCPIFDTHIRIYDAHQYWHESLDFYKNPSEFRRHLNSCLQELRNFTFLLQKEMGHSPGFDVWWEFWREVMKANQFTSWLNESRRTVVHKKNLMLHSKARARIITSYEDVARELRDSLAGLVTADTPSDNDFMVEFSASQSHVEAANLLETIGIPKSLLERSVVTFERIWIDSELPEYEVLSSLNRCFGIFEEILRDAHLMLGSNVDECGVKTGLNHDYELLIGQDELSSLSCMAVTREERSMTINLADGTVRPKAIISQIKYDKRLGERAASKFKINTSILRKSPTSLLEWVDYYKEAAVKIVESGQQHILISFFLLGSKPLETISYTTEDSFGNRKISQNIAETVLRIGADGVVVISELWVSPPTLNSEGIFIAPEEHPDRREFLAIFAEDRRGSRINSLHEISRRRFRQTKVGNETITMEPQEAFSPLRAAWESLREFN
jgi:hypothetical protein